VQDFAKKTPNSTQLLAGKDAAVLAQLLMACCFAALFRDPQVNCAQIQARSSLVSRKEILAFLLSHFFLRVLQALATPALRSSVG